jgi:hypothetical protein
MAANPFPEWLAEVAADAVVVRPDDVTAEARGNLWTFGLSAEQQAVVTTAQVEGFVRLVAAARGRWLADRGVGPMRFYCWHDAQARQLRFSLVSAGSGLPFGCPVEQVAVLGAVVRDFLESGTSGDPQLVWVTVVPSGGEAEPGPAPAGCKIR